MSRPYLSIVIPTYNEAGSIEWLVKKIRKAGVEKEMEIIVVDDDSSDGTGELVRRMMKKDGGVRLVSREGDERGLGVSIRDGISASYGKYVLGMDGDGNHDPKYIGAMLDAVEENGGLVVGSRYVGVYRGEGVREFPRSFVFNCLARMLGMPIWDNTSGFYMCSKTDLGEIDLKEVFRGYGDYHLRLVDAFVRGGKSIVEVPIRYGQRKSGVSKSHNFRMFWSYLWVVLKLRWGGEARA